MKRKREFTRVGSETRAEPARGKKPEAEPERSAAPQHDPGLSAEARSILRLQGLIGNAQVQRLLVQRAPEGEGLTLAGILASLGEVSAAPPVDMFLDAIHAESPEAGLLAYFRPSVREQIRDRYDENDAHRILGALLRAPYEPGAEAILYEVLGKTDKTAFAEVNDEVNQRFAEETSITGSLNWKDAGDRPFARRWLMIRDKVMEERQRAVEKEEERKLKDDLLALAASPPDVHSALLALDAEMKLKLLTDKAFKKQLRDALGKWSEFAGCMEDLGAFAPTAEELRSEASVLGAIAGAWEDSLPNSPFGLATSRDEIETHNHEEGGWIYVNLVTNEFEFRRQTAEEHSSFEWDEAGNLVPIISLEMPPEPEDCVLVANFHVHPNLPEYAGASPPDGRSISGKAVPGLLRGHDGVLSYGDTDKRATLRGKPGYP
jgi:hypothetical protein